MHRQDFARLGVPVLAALAIGSLATSAFAQSSTIIVAPSAPPPPRVETDCRRHRRPRSRG